LAFPFRHVGSSTRPVTNQPASTPRGAVLPRGARYPSLRTTIFRQVLARVGKRELGSSPAVASWLAYRGFKVTRDFYIPKEPASWTSALNSEPPFMSSTSRTRRARWRTTQSPSPARSGTIASAPNSPASCISVAGHCVCYTVCSQSRSRQLSVQPQPESGTIVGRFCLDAPLHRSTAVAHDRLDSICPGWVLIVKLLRPLAGKARMAAEAFSPLSETTNAAAWLIAILAAALVLLAPALWNGFPLLQYDTGGYLARWHEEYLVPSRAGAHRLALGASLHFWPVLVMRAALTVWVLALLLRCLSFGTRPLVLLTTASLLSVGTTLPWLTAIYCGGRILVLPASGCLLGRR
jgi:hypothetical protein